MAVITVSRTIGSLGDVVAARLADRLGYRLVGRHELARLASDLGGQEAMERSPELRERSPSFWERLNEDRRRHASVLRNVMISLADADRAVIVGLGAGQLLRDLHYVLRLQVVAPLEFRLQQLMEHGHDETPGPLSRERARELQRHGDREAAGYMRYLFNIDWLESHHWDMVINSARLGTGPAVEVLARLVGEGAFERTAEDIQRLGNLILASRIEALLLNQPSVWVSGLKVSAHDGQVRIEGEVLAEEDRDAAESLAREVDGVRGIDNDLRIQPPPLTGM